ncbi:MAG: hypothetical protein ABIR33_12015, partial [Pyrinomonadaceae bacterium]
KVRVHVSLAPNGRMILNRKAYELIGKPPAVYLYYSRTTDTIAVEPVQSPRLAESLPVLQEKKTSVRVNAAPFCRHFNIRVPATSRFIRPEVRNGRLLLKLSEVVTITTAMKGRKRAKRSSENEP